MTGCQSNPASTPAHNSASGTAPTGPRVAKWSCFAPRPATARSLSGKRCSHRRAPNRFLAQTDISDAVPLTTLLEMAAEGAPDRVVVGDVSTGLTAARLLDRSRRAGARFGASGAEHVAFLALNSEAVPVALFGAAFAGIPLVPVSYRATDHQLREIFSRISPALV